MNRRNFLGAAAIGTACSLGGCLGSEDATLGRIDLIGHEPWADTASYTFGHISSDGEWGVVGSTPVGNDLTASTLFDLSDLEEPTAMHRLDAADKDTGTNDVKFDPLREGLYYRSQEPGVDGGPRGIEVVDFGWREGSPTEPVIVARFDTSTGVHKFATHSEEPILYLVDIEPHSATSVIVVDVSTPANPDAVSTVGPTGACHAVEYDPVREALHAAFTAGDAEGYVIYDAGDPYDLTVHGEFRYGGQPVYTELGKPGFESCHHAHWDPERDLAIIADESDEGIPGGKHVFDVGWDEGSLDDPVPIGFTHSPDAREMGPDESFWWSTHFHDVLYDDGVPLLIDGGIRQGAWVCNLEDPRDPVPTERFATTDRTDPAITPPLYTWGAVYNEERDFTFVTDSHNGAFTFDVSAEPARGADDGGPDGHYDEDRLIPDE